MHSLHFDFDEQADLGLIVLMIKTAFSVDGPVVDRFAVAAVCLDVAAAVIVAHFYPTGMLYTVHVDVVLVVVVVGGAVIVPVAAVFAAVVGKIVVTVVGDDMVVDLAGVGVVIVASVVD